MNKLILSIAVLAALTACSKEEAKTKSNDEVIKETISSDDFKNLDKDAQAIVLRALSDKEGTPGEVANDPSGNVDDTELTPEEQAMDDGSGLTTEDNGATIHFGNGWTLFKEGTTNFEIRKVVEAGGPVYRYMGDIDGNHVTMVFTCAKPNTNSFVLFAMANGGEFSSAGVESFQHPVGRYRYISMGPDGSPARSGNMPNGTLEIVSSADLNKNTIDVNYRDFDSLVLRNKNKFTHSSDMSNSNFISRWYNGQYDNMYLGRFSEAENAVLTGQATEVPEINGKVNTTKPILISSIPKLTAGEGKIFNKHPCNFF
jgi:hypothetical protein|nr:MAG TPA: Protein involved in gliding motility 9 Secretion System Type.5A [Caudoviricetes sp.]